MRMMNQSLRIAGDANTVGGSVEERINTTSYAPVAQLDRVGGFEPLGREFESLRVRQTTKGPLYAGLFCLWTLVSENSPVRQNALRFGRPSGRPARGE